MDGMLKADIVDYLNGRVDAVGFAPVERFREAPDAHHPALVCRNAETVIVVGRLVPKGVLVSPQYQLYLLHRSYHTLYAYLDELSLELSNWIEGKGYLAVQVPSYAPVVYRGTEPWGILSLKHAAVLAGMGGIGRNGLFYHSKFGSRLRLTGVVTSARLPGDSLCEESCPEDCSACREACPAGAFRNGLFDKALCLAHSIRHAIYPLALKTEQGRKKIETVFNTAGYNAWMTCCNCQTFCPKNSHEKKIEEIVVNQ